MRTVPEFCEYCESIGNIPKTERRKPAEKNFQIIANSLASGEEAKIAFNGFLNMKSATKSDGLFSIVVTDSRIIMAMKIAFSQDSKSIKLDKITATSFATHSPFTNFATITISTISEEFKITMDIKSGEKVNSELQALL